MPGMLFIVATPIGNLEDINERAQKTLADVDFILAEDTRVAGKLAARFGLRTPIIRYDANSGAHTIQEIIAKLKDGKNLALVSDAGTPAISDPGAFLVAETIRVLGAEAKIIPIPGPSAVTAALSIAGFPADSFVFFGFISPKKGRGARLDEIAAEPRTAVFFESPFRIKKTLDELGIRSPERQVVVCRELTKMFESVYRGTIGDIAASPDLREQGEFVVVLGPK